jgi:hypothetical protein
MRPGIQGGHPTGTGRCSFDGGIPVLLLVTNAAEARDRYRHARSRYGALPVRAEPIENCWSPSESGGSQNRLHLLVVGSGTSLLGSKIVAGLGPVDLFLGDPVAWQIGCLGRPIQSSAFARGLPVAIHLPIWACSDTESSLNLRQRSTSDWQFGGNRSTWADRPERVRAGFLMRFGFTCGGRCRGHRCVKSRQPCSGRLGTSGRLSESV